MTDDFYKTGHTRLKQKRAVAMGYNEREDSAPKIKAKGKGYTAEEIIKRAEENGIPVQEDPSLVALLSQLEINERIPESLYEVVAEVFAFIYYVDREKTDK
ncbi:EscU/YscU/HrcU family type III secretion system export apparatus switch protein [Salipaludibacillus sp. CUR1]|uniref:EscU/YscU/HrcU family type III secretion system export apparatus switch protein n=1 Tax=Salipaludibacillus sp. CUR1 TaxID=2820003 RepID=UPI001E58DB08|nr:EscU/YscU/HrcU family type III secretion system export apparatus switch protein [Salipaludibacillus sp. CUR1]MCE7794621.1 EscU/YscU/HrcU family type III secretion system export apparatus switch protein [Salipaludibacillus sp. CUR1]